MQLSMVKWLVCWGRVSHLSVEKGQWIPIWNQVWNRVWNQVTGDDTETGYETRYETGYETGYETENPLGCVKPGMKPDKFQQIYEKGMKPGMKPRYETGLPEKSFPHMAR